MGVKWNKSGFVQKFQALLKHAVRTRMSSEPWKTARKPAEQPKPVVHASTKEQPWPSETCDAHFATTGSIGIVDLGASQTVVGDHQVKEILQSLPEHVQKQVKRTTCNLTFRFGNQQTLCSRHAMLLPLGESFFRIAIVPGKTPFLLSSSFLKGIGAVIDTDQGTMWSKVLKKELVVERSSKNLFLMDINQLWKSPTSEQQVQPSFVAGLTSPLESCTKKLSSSEGCDLTERYSGSQVPEKQKSMSDQDVEESKIPATNVMPATSAQSSDQCPLTATKHPIANHGIRESATASVPRVSEESRPSSEPCENRGDESGAVVQGEDRIWESKTESGISRGVQRQCLDGLVCDDIREKQQAGTPALHQVCGEAPELRDQARCHDIDKDPEGNSSRSQSHGVGRFRDLGSDLRARHNEGVRTAGNHQGSTDGGANDLHADGKQEHVRSHGPARNESDGSSSTSPRTECQERTVDSIAEAQMSDTSQPDLDFDFISSNSSQGYQSHNPEICEAIHQGT